MILTNMVPTRASVPLLIFQFPSGKNGLSPLELGTFIEAYRLREELSMTLTLLRV